MCFAPQQRALFRDLHVKKCSETGVLCTFWLGHVLRATTACNFSISHLASWLRTRRFSEPTFRPSGAHESLEKHSVLRLSYLFRAPGSSFFWDFLFCDLLSSSLLFSSLTLPISVFHLSILSEVWLLDFLRSHYISYISTVYIYIYI